MFIRPRTLLLGLIFLAVGSVGAHAECTTTVSSCGAPATQCYRLNPNSTLEITACGLPCYTVKNGPAGPSLMVPTNSAQEWQAFQSKPPKNISVVRGCGAPGPGLPPVILGQSGGGGGPGCQGRCGGTRPSDPTAQSTQAPSTPSTPSGDNSTPGNSTSGNAGASGGTSGGSSGGTSGGGGGGDSSGGGGNSAGNGCFLAGSQVLLYNGSIKNIEQVLPGEFVRAVNGLKNKVLELVVLPLGNQPVYGINGGPVFVTGDHPFLTAAGWKSISVHTATAKVMAERYSIRLAPLAAGDALVRFDGATVSIRSLQSLALAPAENIYNLHLDGDHTYFVNGFAVHNK